MYRDGVFLGQTPTDYSEKLNMADVKDVTDVWPDEITLKKLLIAQEVVRKVPSNAIVIGNGYDEDGKVTCFQTYGIGSSTKRSRAAEIAVKIAGRRATGSLAASDGFFPFKDTAEILYGAGISYIIQPGGSIRDSESIEVANRNNSGMVFTGKRIFSHH